MLLRNFLFHRVSTDRDDMWPPMQPQLFDRIIGELTRKFKVVSLEDYLSQPGSYTSHQKKMATVLFDDGYKDNIEYAAPILKKYKCPASFYVVTDCINRNIPTWTYILDNSLLSTQVKKIDLPFDFVPEKFKSIQIRETGTVNPVTRELKPWLKKSSNAHRLAVLQAIQDQCNDVEVAKNKMMSWDDVRELKREGFIIGSHSHSHPCLSALTDKKEIEDELKLSGSIIEKELGEYPATISYPMNNYDDRVTQVAKEQGYKFGLAVGEDFYQPGVHDIYKIPRAELHQEPWWKVQVRMKGIYRRLKKIWP